MGVIRFMRTEDDTRPPGKMNLDLADPTWPDVEGAIAAMDGVHRSLVMLSLTDDVYSPHGFMGIGGGTDDRFFCSVMTLDGEQFSLTTPLPISSENVKIFSGQMSVLPGDEIVGRDRVLFAARTWFDNGTMEKSMLWRQG